MQAEDVAFWLRQMPPLCLDRLITQSWRITDGEGKQRHNQQSSGIACCEQISRQCVIALPLAIDHSIYVHILPPTGTKHLPITSSLVVAFPLSLCILGVT